MLRREKANGMKYVFIVGCPRSGTTLLQQALNRHSQIVIPPESKFFYYFYGQSYRRQSAHLERINSDLGIELVPPAQENRTTGGSQGVLRKNGGGLSRPIGPP